MYRFACALWVCLPVAFVGTTRAEVPATLSHQGVIAVSGHRFTGLGDFRFALVDPVSGEYLWTNDDSPLANCPAPTDVQPCLPPVGAVPLVVVNGVFNVALGDNGMHPIDASIFDMPGVALRVWFNDRKNGTHQLVPDQLIDSVAFAFRTATIDNNAVSSIKIADGQVNNADLANNAVNSAKIQDATVTAADLANDSVAAAEIAAGAVGTSEIADGSVANVDLADNAVNSAKIQDGTVTAADLGNDSVAAAEIAAGAVGNADLADNAVNSAKIQDATITAADLATDSVAAAEIAAGGVGTSEIADGSVGNADVANNAVNSAKIQDGTVTAADLSNEPGVATASVVGSVTVDNSFSSMVSQTIDVPAPGSVLAIGSAQLATSSTSLLVCGISTSGTSLPAEQSYATSGVTVTAVTVHHLFAVSAGNKTFHFVGSSTSDLLSARNPRLSLVYFPTSYGAVSAAEEGFSGGLDVNQIETHDTAGNDAGGNEFDEMPPAPDTLNADQLLQRLAAMEERIHELERIVDDPAP
ncbi:MAG: hypothetical protein HOP29_04680 [Phycisphaerales bacterium]|nr:hypothetical protein [Phycisphaerales bacterium]